MIFPWIWKLLPGNKRLKVFLAALLVAAITVVLFLVVFPWLDNFLVAPPVVVGN
jgi:xanthine/uracil permease